MAKELSFQLNPGETVLKEVAGDSWSFLSQTRGHFTFTNQRIHFRGGFATEFTVFYSDIQSIDTCNVGGLIPLIPTGIRVVTKDNKKQKLSVLGRKDIMNIIKSNM